MGIIFDLDGTLINSLGVHRDSVKRGFDTVLGKNRVTASFVAENIRYPFSMLIKNLRRNGIEITDKDAMLVLSTADRYMTLKKISEGVKFFRGAKEVISLIRSTGINYCIATSMDDAEVKNTIRALSLSSLGTMIINSKNRRREKPDPYLLNIAIRETGMNRAHTCYIGDSKFDFLAARRAKIGFLGVFNRRELSGKGQFFGNLTTLRKYIEKNAGLFFD